MLLRVECKERDGTVLRTVRQATKTPELILWLYDRVKDIPNFIGKFRGTMPIEDMRWLFLPDVSLYLVDDVGAIILRETRHLYGDVHITFWDRKLRGREELGRRVAQWLLAEKHLGLLVTVVPEDSPTVIAFAKRVGFEEQPPRSAGHVRLVYVPRGGFTVKSRGP